MCLLEVQHLKDQVPREQAVGQNPNRLILNKPTAKTLENQNDSPVIKSPVKAKLNTLQRKMSEFSFLSLPPTMFSSVQQLSRVQLFVTPWAAACQASLSITNSWSLLKLMSIESVIPSNHLILCYPTLLLPLISPSIRVLSNESVLCIRWPKYWNFSFSIISSNEYSRLISFRMDWSVFDKKKKNYQICEEINCLHQSFLLLNLIQREKGEQNCKDQSVTLLSFFSRKIGQQ